MSGAPTKLTPALNYIHLTDVRPLDYDYCPAACVAKTHCLHSPVILSCLNLII